VIDHQSLLLHEERLDLLLDVLRRDIQVHDISRLRSALLAAPTALEGMLIAATRRQVLPVVLGVLEDNGILPFGSLQRFSRDSLPGKLRDARQQFSTRRQLLTQALRDIIAALNSNGIQPLILKGSMSLLTGHPDWRFQRDIDVAVDPGQADDAVSALKEVGFRICDGAHARPHHLPAMERQGLPATVELHVRLAGSRARSVLPDHVLLDTVTHLVWNGLEVRQLGKAGFVLHGLAHHHFQNRGYLFGTFSLKGLIECAASLEELDNADIDQCLEMIRPLPRLHAGFQLWCALAQTVLGARLDEQLQPDPTAVSLAAATAKRFVEGQTSLPVTAAWEQMKMVARLNPQARFGKAFAEPLLEAGHTAVWFDHQNQRRNASGILQEC
jgi:hypothetical protein